VLCTTAIAKINNTTKRTSHSFTKQQPPHSKSHGPFSRSQVTTDLPAEYLCTSLADKPNRLAVEQALVVANRDVANDYDRIPWRVLNCNFSICSKAIQNLGAAFILTTELASVTIQSSDDRQSFSSDFGVLNSIYNY